MAPIHESDPGRRPDTDFSPGTLHHLVPGNAGRMLDARRTPIRVAALRPEIASWICEVTAFEDRGALWTLPFESVTHFQFEHSAARAAGPTIEDFEKQIRRFAVALDIEPDEQCALATHAEIARRRSQAEAWLADRDSASRLEAGIDHESRRAPPAILAASETFMRQRGLMDMDHAFASAYVTNPGAGEVVKGHLIVMAEIGIVSFHGSIVRDPVTFKGPWRKTRRVEHVLWRAAFVQAMLGALGLDHVELFRGVSSERPIEPSRATALESWSFSREVAESVAGPPGSRAHRIVESRKIPRERVWMTYLETRAMNRQFLEAEAVVFAGQST